ncbi:MAG TPA: PilN domain-containing protein [Atribacteraceae bacterium]|nr:PilN domain-containing protein [Atribacteraceae bacterium]
MELKSFYPVKLNLLPIQYRVQKTPHWVRLFFTVLLIGASTFTGYAVAILNFRIDLVGLTIETLEREAAYLRELNHRMQEVQQEIHRIEGRVTILQDLVLREPEWLNIIEAIGVSMPPDLFLEEASFGPDHISFSGYSVSIFSLASFIESLSGYRKYFTSAEFQSLSLQEGMYFFTLSLELNQS